MKNIVYDTFPSLYLLKRWSKKTLRLWYTLIRYVQPIGPILFLGTSIGDNGLFMEIAAWKIGLFGTKLIKRSQGGSRASIPDEEDLKDLPTREQYSCLLETIDEKNARIERFLNDPASLTATPEELGFLQSVEAVRNNLVTHPYSSYGWVGVQDVIRGWSYEMNCIGEFVNEDSPFFKRKVGLIVIELGYNDKVNKQTYKYIKLLNSRDPKNPGYKEALARSYDRKDYVTAKLYLIREIRSYNPYQQILLVGHYTEYNGLSPENRVLGNAKWLIKTQKKLAKYLGLPIVLLHKSIGTSDQPILRDRKKRAAHIEVLVPDGHHQCDDTRKTIDIRAGIIIANFIKNNFPT